MVETFGVEELEISDYALREGVLLDTIQRTRGGSLHHLRDVSRRSVLHLAELCDEEPEHSAHVARLALELFDELAAIPGLNGARTGWASRPGSTWRPARSWPTSGCSSPTAATTCTRTT